MLHNRGYEVQQDCSGGWGFAESIAYQSDVNEIMLLIGEMRDKAINRINSTSSHMSTSNNVERLEEVVNSNLSPNTKFPAI